MSTKVSPRRKKMRQKEDINHEIVAQVHKPAKVEVSSDREVNKTENSEESSSSNKTYFLDDKNEKYSANTPSREISVDGETQINSKILNLIETEMKRDLNKHNHFSDSRPQSLSFYEEEKMPEELSGNLELLSPEERKHYKRRKDHMDTEERNAYNVIQDIYNRGENEDIIMNGSLKKSKSRKKRHGEAEIGLGDSREMMIPKEKRKSKKKRRECSPISSSSSKKKHRKKDDDFEPRNDITIALEELQDDVFENNLEDHARPEKMKKSPRKSDKLYVQKKNKFEVTNRVTQNGKKNEESNIDKSFADLAPIEVAVAVQRRWYLFTNFCHGLLGGLALAHFVLINTSYWNDTNEYVEYLATFNDFYECTYYLLTVICIVSVFDRYDFAHWDSIHVSHMWKYKKSILVVLLYLVALLLHLSAARLNDKISTVSYNASHVNVTDDEVISWISLSGWKDMCALMGWVGVGIGPSEDLLHAHLKSMVHLAGLEPIHMAVIIQEKWMEFAFVCHGLLAGLALAHYVLTLNIGLWIENETYLDHLGTYNDFYECMYHLLIVICIVSMFDRYDLGHWDLTHVVYLWLNRKSLLIILLYVIGLLIHLSEAEMDNKFSLLRYEESKVNIRKGEMINWVYLCNWKDILVVLAWLFLALFPPKKLLDAHLKNLLKYIPAKS